MLTNTFTCRRCGNCCLHSAFSEVGEEDIVLWTDSGRDDILAWVHFRAIGNGDHAYEVWIDPITKEQVERCPWLEKLSDGAGYMCQIHDVKPSICRYFPASNKHAQDIGCLGLEDTRAEENHD
jgi:Fe-S-cluster containining protein